MLSFIDVLVVCGPFEWKLIYEGFFICYLYLYTLHIVPIYLIIVMILPLMGPRLEINTFVFVLLFEIQLSEGVGRDPY